MTAALERVAELVRRASGIRVRPSQYGALAAAVAKTGAGPDVPAFLEAAGDPKSHDGVIERLVDELTVKETYFGREPSSLASIDWHGLLAAAHANGQDHVRVWSAACASGEEPYTLAMLACEAFGCSAPPVSILATDISASALARARDGHYGPRAVRQLEPSLVERYLERDGDTLSVRAHLRRLVEVERHNLVRDDSPAGQPFELILCRNVLIYLDPPEVDRAITFLRNTLAPQGVLLLGAADRLCHPRLRSGWQADAATTGRLVRLHPPRGERRSGRRRRDLAEPQSPEQRLRERPKAPAAEASATVRTTLGEAQRAADEGRLAAAAAAATDLLADDPTNVSAHFIAATTQLVLGDAETAVYHLRRALYIDPSLAAAAFQLGRAYDAIGNTRAARLAYEQALRTFDPDHALQRELLGHVDVADLAAACRIRVDLLRAESA